MSHLLRSALVCALLLPSGPAAAEQTLTLDPEGSKIGFTLGATLHSVEGMVRLARGEVTFLSEGGPASGEIVVDATSADTDHEGRDKDMHEKVLESDTFGTFVLRPTRTVGALSPSGTSSIELHGDLEIHGGTHPITLATEVTVDDGALTGTATLDVPYVDWGMKNPSKLFLRVEKSVTVQIELSGTVSRVANDDAPTESSESR